MLLFTVDTQNKNVAHSAALLRCSKDIPKRNGESRNMASKRRRATKDGSPKEMKSVDRIAEDTAALATALAREQRVAAANKVDEAAVEVCLRALALSANAVPQPRPQRNRLS